MARKGRHAKGGRTTPRATRPAGYRPRYPGDDPVWDEPEPDFMADVRRALVDDQPLRFLDMVSSMLAAIDPRRVAPPDSTPEEETFVVGRTELLNTFIEVDRPETTALLAAVAGLTTDRAERKRLQRAVNARSHQLPPWLARLDEAEAHQAAEVTHVLRDGDSVVVGVRLVTGEELSAVVYIDHNEGGLVKDAFVVPQSIAKSLDILKGRNGEPDVVFGDLPGADAKVRVLDGIDVWARTVPVFESETWPACRSLVEWMVGLLPDGGQGYQRPEWSDAARDDLTERFFNSKFGRALDHPDHRGLFDAILWFACDYGPGDPLRWSPASVEILLEDWIPRKILADAEYLSRAPEVLRAFIRYCHGERGIPSRLTDQTLEMVDLCEPDYQEIIRTPRPMGPAGTVAGLRDLAFDSPWDNALDDHVEDDVWDGFSMRTHLEREVGGPDALAALDDVPLPDEPFDWTVVPDDVRDRLSEILALVDGCCDELLDVEHRTAARRVLARICSHGPEVFRRRGANSTAAAGIVLWVCSMNRTWKLGGRRISQKALLDHFGLKSSVTGRADTLIKAAGFPRYHNPWGVEVVPGSPEYLVARKRRDILASLARLEDDEA